MRSSILSFSRTCLVSGFPGSRVVPRAVWSPANSFSVSAPSHGNVETSVDSSGIATLSMNKGPANSLNMEFLVEITEAVRLAEKESKAILLTSSLPTIFCAGLDITELYQPEKDRLRLFWRSVQDVWLSLYLCKVPTAAAINGHSPAGGCLLAMSCDYRSMVGPDYVIGLNETQLGIVAPTWFKDTMVNTIGHRKTEISLMLGSLYPAQKALAIGLVDSVVSSKEEAVEDTTKMLKQLVKIPSAARHVTKELMRGETHHKLAKDQEADIDTFVSLITQPQIQKPLGMYLEALKNKSKKKK